MVQVNQKYQMMILSEHPLFTYVNKRISKVRKIVYMSSYLYSQDISVVRTVDKAK